MQVGFMVVGAQKCATRSLCRILATHPDIEGSRPGEPHFFSKSPDWRADIATYEQMFEHAPPGALKFEGSTTYTFYPHCNLEIWEDLYDYNPYLKIIYLVRDPLERVTSAYMHLYERGYLECGFEQALQIHPLILNVTRYATQIKPYIERFGRDNVRILFFEDFVRDPAFVMRQVAGFLGVDVKGFRGVGQTHRNPSVGGAKRHHRYDAPGMLLRRISRYAPWMWQRITDNTDRAFTTKPLLSPAFKRMVLRMLDSEIEELQEITKRDLSHWRETSDGKATQDATYPAHQGQHAGC